jgi:uncharacterized membrane protein (UPF0127 family)
MTVPAAQLEYVVFNLDRKATLAERVRLAGSSAARRKGLLGVDGLSPSAGLWIAPCEAIHTFGMKMPIDAVFLDRQCQVRKVRPNLAPSRISLCLRADSVLELQAGTVARTGPSVGDRLRFEPAAGTAALSPGGR